MTVSRRALTSPEPDRHAAVNLSSLGCTREAAVGLAARSCCIAVMVMAYTRFGGYLPADTTAQPATGAV